MTPKPKQKRQKIKKKFYKCLECGGKANLECDIDFHHFCTKCFDDEEECPACEPSYLHKFRQ